MMGEGSPPGWVGRGPAPQYAGMQNPFTPDDQQAVQAGQALYLQHCATCHGVRGLGDGPQAPYVEAQPASYSSPLLLTAFRQHQDVVYTRVADGITQTSMPPFGHELDETELWQVITYAWYLGEQAAAGRW
jgi:mono/diheme cytochrome c family protein